ncbi:MAG: tetratricopeptide repeat protein [Acidobacteriota bacterium]|nr:tetratricopeptide repeat protein [Acidobacteriota bacterium]
MRRKIITSFISLCLLLTAVSTLVIKINGQGQNKKQIKQANSLVAEGDTSFQQKNYRVAIDKYTQAIALVPNLAKAHFWKGYAHYYLKEFDQAIPEMDTALAQGYTPLDVYRVRFFLHYQQKNYDLALQDAQKAQQFDPKSQEFGVSVGEIQLAKGSYQEALDTFQKFIQLNPNNADVYYYIASAYNGLNDIPKQTEAAEEAVKRNTKFLGESYFLIATALQKDKKYQPAAEAYQKAISAKPDNYAAYHNLSDIYRIQNKYPAAIDITKKGLINFPDDGNLLTDLSWYYNLAGRNFESITAAQQAVKALPDKILGYTILCRAYYETKQNQLALQACDSALKINPNDGVANVYEGFSYLSLNKTDTANTFFKKAIDGMQEFTGANPEYSDGFYLLGNAYYYGGQPQKAIDAYLKSLELSPDFAKARFNLGLTYFVKGDLPAAREQYTILLKTDKTLAEKLKALIDKK